MATGKPLRLGLAAGRLMMVIALTYLGLLAVTFETPNGPVTI